MIGATGSEIAITVIIMPTDSQARTLCELFETFAVGCRIETRDFRI